MSQCLGSIQTHLMSLRLLINPEKTKVMWCQSSRMRSTIDSPIVFGSTILSPVNQVKYLGVTLDSHMSLSANVTQTSKTCFSMLRRLYSLRGLLTLPVLKNVTSALVLNRLDYCITIHAGLPASTLWRLQRILHASARLVFGARRSDHIQPLLRHLRWPSVRDRIDGRLATIAFQCQRELAPSYLSDEIVQAAALPSRARLRSAARGRLCVPKFRRPTLGGRAFKVTAAKAWNRFPQEVTSAHSLSVFKTFLKCLCF